MNRLDCALATGVRAASRVIAGASGRCLSILIFHRVLPAADPIFPHEVDAQRFERLMRVVATGFEVLPLADAARRLAADELPPRALAITFDDGYADNHDVALPILRRLGLPACFFVATGFLDGGRMFNDTVIESVRRSPLAAVDLSAFGLGTVALGSPARKAAAIGRILPLIKYLRPDERQAALARLDRLLAPGPLPDDLMMRSSQVRALREAGMEIGAHTVHHPILETLADADAEREIATSRERLQDIVDAPVELFAYPNGRPDQDYGARHAAIVRRLGFVAAVSTAPGVARAGADRFQLPRYSPWNPAPWTWAARLVAARTRTSFAIAEPAVSNSA